jgi:TonB-dependent receptor
LTVQTARQMHAGAGIDLEWQAPDGPRLEAGMRWSDSWRRAENRDWRNDYFSALLGRPGLTWADLGLSASTYAAAVPGIYDWALPRIDSRRLQDLFSRYVRADSFDTCGTLAVNNENCNTQSGREGVAAAYLAAHMSFGNWEIVPGWRQEQTAIDNVYWVFPQTGAVEQPGHWQGSHTFYNEGLPSLYLVRRPAAGPVLNIGLWRSYARPSFQQLAGGARSTLTDGELTIESGNPDLKPVTALNGEVSLTWAKTPGRHMRLAGFAKALDHYLYDGGSGYINAAPDDIGAVRHIIPRNGGRGRVLGLEWQGQAALAAGVTATAAITRQWTDVDTGSAALGRHQPLQNAPGLIASAAVTCRHADLSGTLTYHYTSAYVSGYDTLLIQAPWDDEWVKPSQRLDAGGAWQVNRTIRVRINIDNLLDATSYWAHVGKHSLAISDIVESGRTFRMALEVEF